MIFEWESEALQFCRECVAEHGRADPDCPLCGGAGVREVYDPLARSFSVVVHGVGHERDTDGELKLRVRPTIRENEPLLELP